ncbi:MAG: polysaccharide deacetylase family protein, partial [Candidatus Zixiibacteriota bacterium]
MKSLAFHKVEPGFSWGVTNCQPHHFREIIREASRSGRGEVCLTFDDGYASFLEYADPELRQFGLSATIYILTDYLGALNSWDYSSRPRPVAHLDRTQIQQLAEHGYRIGSHTCSHRDLTRLSDEEISFELGESRRILENLIDSPVTEISYPFGRYNRRVEELAREAGSLRG